MKHATWNEPRSATIVFRFLISLANFQNKRHTLIRVRLHGLACAPRATLSLRAFARGEAGRVPPATGMSFKFRHPKPFGLLPAVCLRSNSDGGQDGHAPKWNARNYIKTSQQIARGMFGYWFSAGGLEKSNMQACSPAHHLTLWSGNKETVSAKTLNAAQKFGRRNNLDWRIRESHHVTSDNYICAPGLRGGNLKRILKIRMLCPKI